MPCSNGTGGHFKNLITQHHHRVQRAAEQAPCRDLATKQLGNFVPGIKRQFVTSDFLHCPLEIVSFSSAIILVDT